MSTPLLLAAALLASVSPLWAHDFWLVPDLFAGTEETVSVWGQNGIHFPSSELAIPLARIGLGPAGRQRGSGFSDRRASDSTAAVAALQRFHAALGNGDSTAALALLAPDAIILESGEIQTRQEYASHHLMADIDFARAIKSERAITRVVMRGDVAWITETSVTRGIFRGRALNSAGAELAVLARGPNGWQIRAIHWSSYARKTQ